MQAVGLIAAEIERNGIATSSISLLIEITSIIKPPRALFVPFDLGYPLGRPNDPEIQHRVIEAAMRLFDRRDTPLIEHFAPGYD